MRKKIIILEFVLFFVLIAGVILYTQANQKSAYRQDASLYYLNISGKQRVLSQRIVFLSQIITTNYVLKNDNHHNSLELRECINELTNIHKILQNFVISTVIEEDENSTLDDVYFGSGNLSFKMENFLENANQLFYANSLESVLRINQSLLRELEEYDGLLTSLELATLSQQIYAQNILKEQQNYTHWLLYSTLFVGILQILLLFFGLLRHGTTE